MHILCIILCMHYVRGAFKDFPVSDKIFKKALQTIRIICLALINNFFANEKIRPYLFNRFVTTLVGLK